MILKSFKKNLKLFQKLQKFFFWFLNKVRKIFSKKNTIILCRKFEFFDILNLFIILFNRQYKNFILSTIVLFTTLYFLFNFFKINFQSRIIARLLYSLQTRHINYESQLLWRYFKLLFLFSFLSYVYFKKLKVVLDQIRFWHEVGCIQQPKSQKPMVELRSTKRTHQK